MFDFTGKDCRCMRIEELAWQLGEGDRVAQEELVCDPAQTQPAWKSRNGSDQLAIENIASCAHWTDAGGRFD